MTPSAPSGLPVRSIIAAIAVPLVLAACASPQTPPSSTGTGEPPRSVAAPAPGSAPAAQGTVAPPAGTAATTPQSAAAAAQPVDPAIARPQAQKLALEAVDQLQNGDEPGAAATIERALALDANNELARKLDEQIRADAQKELGNVYFRYTVQKDDTLSKLAQQYLGDRFRFYLLAKYNEITNPSRLAAGQVIKLPGKGPLPPVAATEPVPPAPLLVKPEEPRREDGIAELMAKAADLEKGGNAEAAYFAYADILQRAPNHPDATKRRDAIRTKLVAQYDREATQAFQRQNLDLAIDKWDRVLEIDPANRKARLERDRAADLKKRMQAKFGNK